MQDNNHETLAKVPEVTLLFWIMKIAATTLGETGGDALSMSLDLGYLLSTAIFAAIFFIMISVQIRATRFHPVIYWTTIVATTTVGTTLADYLDRSLGIGYSGGTTILLVLLISTLVFWYQALGSISINTVSAPKQEVFYWTAIMFSQTLGTALGDWMADSTGLGYAFSAVLFGSALVFLVGIYYLTSFSRVLLFWAAFILTRPLGAVLGDLLDKPLDHGGLALSRYNASLVLIIFIAFCIKLFNHRAASNHY